MASFPSKLYRLKAPSSPATCKADPYLLAIISRLEWDHTSFPTPALSPAATLTANAVTAGLYIHFRFTRDDIKQLLCLLMQLASKLHLITQSVCVLFLITQHCCHLV